MGYSNAASLQTDVCGWNDYERPSLDNDDRQLGLEAADIFFEPKISPARLGPESSKAA
ncbi:MAG: hypothetical protein WBO93_02920 [Gammaproteobacteria bacterium]|jgi:hypothetical protein